MRRKKTPEKDRHLPAAVSVHKGTGYGWMLQMIGWIFVFGCYFGCLRSYGKVERADAVSVVLSDHEPATSEVRSILRAQEEAEREEEICFYWEGGLVSVEEPVYGRSKKVFLAGIQGEAALFDRRIRGFEDEDQKGCIIDRETALELFGSADAEGRELQIQKDIYLVRRVVSWKQRLILIHNNNKDARYSRVFFNCKNENKSNMADQFLMRYGLNGEQAGAEVVQALAGASVWFLPFVLFLELFLYAAGQKKGAAGTRAEHAWKGACLLLIVLLLYVIICNFRLPSDWLPGKWSDFSFWSRRIREEREKMVYFFMVSRTAGETEILYEAACTIVQGILAVFVYFISGIIKRKENR